MEYSSFEVKGMLVVLISYGLGCISTGYYLVRLRLGDDIRQYGSGNIGARNAGRILGTPGFVITLLGDAAKGAAAVWLGLYFQLSLLAVILAMIGVVAGHMWPVQLGFRGGKGIATVLGAMMVLDFQLVLIMVVLFGLVLALLRNFTISGLIAISVAPLIAAFRNYPWSSVVALVFLAILIVVAHRSNIRAFIETRRQSSS
jgi:glycerol-3-phosphate acyltransferase PlsY